LTNCKSPFQPLIMKDYWLDFSETFNWFLWVNGPNFGSFASNPMNAYPKTHHRETSCLETSNASNFRQGGQSCKFTYNAPVQVCHHTYLPYFVNAPVMKSRGANDRSDVHKHMLIRRTDVTDSWYLWLWFPMCTYIGWYRGLDGHVHWFLLNPAHHSAISHWKSWLNRSAPQLVRLFFTKVHLSLWRWTRETVLLTR
jgi:hypothetical protein